MVKQIKDISNFRVDKKIGSGTFSTVYSVTEESTGKRLAVKKILTSPDPRCKEFIHEIKALIRLKSKFVVEIEYFSVRFKRLYIFTSLHKDNLASVLHIYSRIGFFLSIKRVKFIMVQLIKAVRYCHRKDIIHRDIKPSNLVIDKNFKLRLADFGSSLDVRKKPILNINIATSIEYAAPEIGLGFGLDSFSQDVWSIGCVFAELLTNKQIFPDTDDSEPVFFSIYKIIGMPINEKEIMEKLTTYDIDFNVKNPKMLGELCGYEEDSKEIKLLKLFLNPNYSSRINLRDVLTHEFFVSN